MNKLEEQSINTRRRILDAAEQLFFSQGYAHTSVENICAAAGVTKGAFYHHFDNKDAVYRQRFIYRLDRYLEAHYALPDDASAFDRFLLLAQCTFASGRESGKELIGQSMIGLLTNQNSQLFQQERTHTRYLKAACHAAIREGVFPENLSESAAIMLYACLMNGFLFKWASASAQDDECIDWDELLKIEISLLVKKF